MRMLDEGGEPDWANGHETRIAAACVRLATRLLADAGHLRAVTPTWLDRQLQHIDK